MSRPRDTRTTPACRSRSASSIPAPADFDAEFARAARIRVGRGRRAIEQRGRRDPRRRARARRRGGARVHARFDGSTRAERGRARARRAPSCRRRSTRSPPAQRARARSGGARACAATTSASSRPCGRSWSYRDADGTLLGQKVTPLDRVGIYVPGGKAAYPSSRADERDSGAGRRRRRDRHGRADAATARRNPLVLAAARARRRRPRVHDRRRAGGRRARLRHGDRCRRSTRSPARATPTWRSAKRRVFGTVGIDMIAGPTRDPRAGRRHAPTRDWVAMDLFSQAEHDELAQSILLCPDAAYIDARAGRDRPAAAGDAAPRRDPRVARRPRRADPDARAWKRPARSATASRPSTSRSAARDPQRWEPLLRHAGAIFLGALHQREPRRLLRRARTTCCRPRGTARFSSPLGVYDFQKRSSLIEVSEAGAQTLGADRGRAGLRRRPAGACAQRRIPDEKHGASKRHTAHYDIDDDQGGLESRRTADASGRAQP